MWTVMMVAMMLPSLVPMLRHCRLPALVSVGYFSTWMAFGAAVFPLGIALATIEMQQPMLSRAVPIGVGLVVLAAGALQFTAWKARELACWWELPSRGRGLNADPGTALRHGLRLGLHCARCCGNLMAILLAMGVMDLRAMTVVTAAITLERLAPNGERAARVVGTVAVAWGLLLIYGGELAAGVR
jgi:predicted metal-binding membrane protein